MPIKIAEGLPVREKLEREGIFTMETSRAMTQNIRPLKLLIMNLMPLKEATELQLLRLIGNGPLQIDVDFMYTETYNSTNTRKSYLHKYYKTFSEVKDDYFDGLIITGAPVEQMPFEEVDYFEELTELVEWAQTHVLNRFFICWGAQFGLHHYYGIEKHGLDSKLFGVYDYNTVTPDHPYVRGFDEVYRVPHSRHTYVKTEDIEREDDLIILTSHRKFGPDMMVSRDGRDLFVFGHLEYDRETLKMEYERDVAAGLPIEVPENYFPQDDPDQIPIHDWRSHAHLLFHNWINVTYQETPYHLEDLENM